MSKRIEVNPGDKYERLTIIREVEATSGRRFECQCACGSVVIAMLNNMRRKLTTSCGCFR